MEKEFLDVFRNLELNGEIKSPFKRSGGYKSLC